jgi:hypothetical protein
MEALSFNLLFAIAIAVGALVLSLVVASSMNQRNERRIPVRIRRRD